MTTQAKSPGPAARRAFRTGVWAAAALGLAGVGALYWTGALAGYVSVFVVVVLFPVYMLLVASALSQWLGYGKGPADLHRVRRERGEDGDDGSGFW
jgi:FtsH-binding integral membrane protein